MVTVYLAGPDVFLPDAAQHARRKVAICTRYGFAGLPPLNEDIATLAQMHEREAGLAIFRKDVEMMEAADIVIANLTPFRGASADSGTLVELGWFLGRGRPIFGYSNTATLFRERSRAPAVRDDGVQTFARQRFRERGPNGTCSDDTDGAHNDAPGEE